MKSFVYKYQPVVFALSLVFGLALTYGIAHFAFGEAGVRVVAIGTLVATLVLLIFGAQRMWNEIRQDN